MHKVLLIFIITFFFSLPALTLPNKDFTDKQLLCPKLLWGVEFISSNRVKVIETDLNKKTSINEYFYDTDLDLSFINIFQTENNIRDRVTLLN